MSHQCLECNEDFPSLKSLHSHLKAHGFNTTDYYFKHFPRYDLYDKKIIKFKDKDSYFSSLFNSRINLVKYCKIHQEKSAEVVKQCIKIRSEQKNLKRMISTTEARTIIYPTPLLVNSIGLDWCNLGAELNLQCIYDYKQKLTFNLNPLIVHQDSREQKPLKLSCKTIENKLNFGDYTSPSHFKNVFIERKGLSDLAGTLSKGFDRFSRELERARNFNAYIVVLVEEPLQNLISINYLPHTKKIKATGEYLCHQLREIMNNNNNVQFLFVDGRVEAAEILQKIFLLENDIRKTDLQYFYDSEQFLY